MKNIKLTIEYDGTNYSGWQNQENVVSIQGKIEEAIELITNEKVRLIGSGRTDAKVHALGQVANFYTNSSIPGHRFKYAINTVLPMDISIIDSEEVSLDFHSRFSAIKKRYKYVIYNGKMPSALNRNFSYHYIHNLDIEKMRNAAKYLLGTHDFASFKGRRSVVKTTIRTIYEIRIERIDNFIEITIIGNSFLRNMVRIIVGTLIFVGSGKIKEEKVIDIIEDKNRTSACKTAPPQGLFLEKVYYK